MATETTQIAGQAEHAAGMPQLDFTTWGNQIFWLIVALVVVYLILSRVALPRVGAVLADRAGTIANDIAAAEELKQKAKEAEAAYEQALADARTEAHQIVEATRAEIRRDLDAAMAEADVKIAAKAAESEAVIADIRAGAVEAAETVAKDTTAALITALGFAATQETVDGAVSEQLKG